MNEYIWDTDYPTSLLLLIGIYFVINLLSWLKRVHFKDMVLFIQLLIDVLQLSIFFYLAGGASNPFT
ncbi:MAG TPA: hypothetical protein ENJ41_06810, partial [Oceanospirillales bacterium]|nr:hypothetical protein [Oceanospirillales bacterium]